MNKTYSDCFIYTQYPDYQKNMLAFIMNAERIDPKSEKFENILFDIKKRQVDSSLVKILTSDKVVLCIGNNKLPKAFKVFVAKDLKENKQNYKVFIDLTDCVIVKNGVYTCNKPDWIISYLVSAMTSFIYKMRENSFTNNQTIIREGAESFVKLFSYILDRIYKISTIQSLRHKVEYISALYYMTNILGKDFDKQKESIKANAIRIARIDNREANIVDMQLDDGWNKDINAFVGTLNNIFKFKDLSVGLILEKWMSSFGTGTIFALEFFPAFATMLTDTYIGGYINQQITIEKLTGQSMVKFTKEVLKIGADLV